MGLVMFKQGSPTNTDALLYSSPAGEGAAACSSLCPLMISVHRLSPKTFVLGAWLPGTLPGASAYCGHHSGLSDPRRAATWTHALS